MPYAPQDVGVRSAWALEQGAALLVMSGGFHLSCESRLDNV